MTYWKSKQTKKSVSCNYQKESKIFRKGYVIISFLSSLRDRLRQAQLTLLRWEYLVQKGRPGGLVCGGCPALGVSWAHTLLSKNSITPNFNFHSPLNWLKKSEPSFWRQKTKTKQNNFPHAYRIWRHSFLRRYTP